MASPRMRALLVDRPGSVSVVEMDRPRPGRDDVLVEVTAAGICASDVDLLAGTRPTELVRYPIVPGHEWAGRIAAVGSDVRGIPPGLPVVAEGFRACGRCDRCIEGQSNLCSADYAETGFTHAGGFAEFVLVPVRLIHRLPADGDLFAAALLEPAACVAEALLSVHLRPGLRIAVVGSGTIGLLAVAMLKRASPQCLALVDTRANWLARGLEMGASVVFADTDGDVVERLGSDFDLVFEAATGPGAAATAFNLARRGGTVVLAGLHGDARPNIDSNIIPLKQLRVQGVFGASARAWGWVVKLFAGGELDPGRLISHRFALDAHEEAFATIRDRGDGTLKVQLTP